MEKAEDSASELAPSHQFILQDKQSPSQNTPLDVEACHEEKPEKQQQQLTLDMMANDLVFQEEMEGFSMHESSSEGLKDAGQESESRDDWLQNEDKYTKLRSFARGSYDSHQYKKDEAYRALKSKERRLARATNRMQCLTMSQMEVLMENCGLVKQRGANIAFMVDEVSTWREKRGDFNKEEDSDDDLGSLEEEDSDDDDEGSLFPHEFTDLPFDMQGVTVVTMELGLLKSDLQLECLLRNIPYQSSDTKPKLISKLMHYKDTLFN